MANGNTRAVLTPTANLDYGHTYHIVVETAVTDVTGNHLGAQYVGADFTTVATPAAPVITVVTDSATGTTGTVNFTSNVTGTFKVYYGMSTVYGNVTDDLAMTNAANSVILTGLLNSTTYYYKVVATNTANGLTTNVLGDFLTSDSTGPEIYDVNVDLSSITTSGATINWRTDENTDGTIDWGKTTGLLNEDGAVEYTGNGSTTHTATLSALSSNTVYHFKVTATDGTNTTVTIDFTFKTASELVTLDAPPAAGASNTAA